MLPKQRINLGLNSQSVSALSLTYSYQVSTGHS